MVKVALQKQLSKSKGQSPQDTDNGEKKQKMIYENGGGEEFIYGIIS